MTCIDKGDKTVPLGWETKATFAESVIMPGCVGRASETLIVPLPSAAIPDKVGEPGKMTLPPADPVIVASRLSEPTEAIFEIWARPARKSTPTWVFARITSATCGAANTPAE